MHRLIPRPIAPALMSLATLVAVVGCGGDGERVVAAGAAPLEPTTTATSAPPDTVAPTSTTTRARAATTTTTTRAAARSTTTTPALPKVVVAQQGDRVVAVFVATGASLDDPSFTRAKARLTSLGYKGSSGGDTACSRGAEEALPQLEEYSLALEFATEAEAARFAARYGTVIGTAAITVSCAD